ncbi:hypothetical protein ACVWWG_003897 [Bradyrhizobium sp. LB7.2]
MTIHLETQSDLEEAVHALIKRDPRLKPVLATAGMPALRRRVAGFCRDRAYHLRAAALDRERRGDLGPAVHSV